jgi:sulfur-oxidizing protein SoxB
VGEGLFKYFNIRPGTAEAHAFTYLNFEKAAKTYGKVGGFAHLATLVKMLQVPAVLTPCCSTVATPGRAVPRRCGPTVRTWSTPASCWVSTPCARTGNSPMVRQRVQEIVEKDFAGKLDFLAQNVKTAMISVTRCSSPMSSRK